MSAACAGTDFVGSGSHNANPSLCGKLPYNTLTAAIAKRGWHENRIRTVIVGNWLRLPGEVWEA